ncbi:MAG: thymidine phosphorylase [Gemmatimonadales bacterium]
MLTIPLIERKRNGGALTPDEWSSLVDGYTSGRVPDYQMAALLMASFLNGLDAVELGALLDAMRHSGSRLEFGEDSPPRIDKHSTGGVGDKVSLVLAPLVASLGVWVPMMSGRSLGHTGGTLDKLESIRGFRTDLSLERAKRQVEELGCAMIGQTAEIAPADRKLYALRDATATVEAIPLIAASIMSKKLCEGLTGLVLDIKTGDGAFLPDLEDELALAKTMIELGEERDCPTVALLTAMDRPLGIACGNALETAEAILALRGEGPGDLMEVVYALGVEMLLLAGVGSDETSARRSLENAISSGNAAAKFGEIIAAQGGDANVLDDLSLLPRARSVLELSAEEAGYVAQIATRNIGKAIVALGGGRKTKESEIDVAVGFSIFAKPGDHVEKGDCLAAVHANDETDAARGLAVLREAITLRPDPPKPGRPLVSHRVTAAGVTALD